MTATLAGTQTGTNPDHFTTGVVRWHVCPDCNGESVTWKPPCGCSNTGGLWVQWRSETAYQAHLSRTGQAPRHDQAGLA